MFRLFILTASIFILIFTFSFATNKKLSVTFSINPIFGFFSQLAGNKIYSIDYNIIMQDIFDHHSFDISSNLIKKINNSNYLFLVGTLEIEKEIINKVKNKYLVINYVRIKNDDPHVWISVKNSKTIIKSMYEYLLSNRIFSSKEIYNNYKSIYRQYDELDKEIRKSINRNITIFSYHNEFTYFQDDYNINIEPLFYHEDDITPAQLKKLIQKINSQRKVYIILSQNYDLKVKNYIQKKCKNVNFIIFNSNSKDIYQEFRKFLMIK